MNSDGGLVFDVNDFDEAYLGHFTWDLQRFAASLALLGWQKALPDDDDPRAGRDATSRAYLDAGAAATRRPRTTATSRSRLDNTDGPVLRRARRRRASETRVRAARRA